MPRIGRIDLRGSGKAETSNCLSQAPDPTPPGCPVIGARSM